MGRRTLTSWTQELKRRPARQTERFTIRIKPIETKFSSTAPAGTFSGYGALFGETHPTSSWSLPDNYTDTIAPGAFTRTLAEHKALRTLPAMVWSHDISTPVGVWSSMREDRTGLLVEGRLSLVTPEGARANDMLQMADQAGLSGLGLSIGIIVVAAEIDDRKMNRKITDVELLEISPCTVPAIPGARITSVRSA